MMRAAVYEATGPAHEVIRIATLPVPQPGAGAVRVRMRASGINPSDTKRRAGWRGAAMAHPMIVPHSDGAGVIDAVGDGVAAARIGERVWLYNAARGRPFGTCAEFCVVPADHAIALPEGTDFAEGACLGVPAQTAHDAVFSDGPVAGLTVLVQGGAGAVGHYAVQMAAQAGARVIATVSSAEKAAHARAAGAAETVDYRSEDVAARVMALTGGRGVARIVEVDLGANLAADTAIIAENGVIASYSSTAVPEPVLPYYPLAWKGVTLRLVQAYILPPARRAAAVTAITDALRAGTLQHSIAARFPLGQTAAAHAFAERGQGIGTTVVEIGGDA